MKKVYISLICVASLILMTGCQLIVPGAEVTEDGAIIFSASGQSVATQLDPLSVAKAELAAETVAKANLLEAVKGALVSSNVKVEGLVLTSQSAEKAVQGWLARAVVEIVAEEVVVVPEVVVVESNLPQPEVVTPEVVLPETRIVTAIATLTLCEDDLENMKKFVE